MNVLPGQYLPLIPAVAQLPEYINNSIRQKYPDIIKQLTDAVSTSGDFTKESPKHKLNPACRRTRRRAHPCQRCPAGPGGRTIEQVGRNGDSQVDRGADEGMIEKGSIGGG